MMSANIGNIVLVWTTYPADGDPTALARVLVEERLAACVSVQRGLRSVYRWADAVETANEQQLTIKTTRDCLDELRRKLTEMHPYDLPEFLVTPVEGGEAYVEWVLASTGSDRGARRERPLWAQSAGDHTEGS
jgi:periplasmic divalent cation tolerance protein